ncbi:MAG: D-alanine--D-alanine ligase [Oscillospiraceae bacterium]|nr:D-alanine--D-alanine ligase [Oscillospiraceae bacterium]
MAKKRIAVLFGGASEDHGVSLMSAHSVLKGLDKSKYDILPIGITRAGRWLYFPGDYSQIPDGTWEANLDCCSAILSPDPLHGGVVKILDETGYSLQRVDVVFPVLHGKYGECGQIQALCKLSSISYVGSGFAAAALCSDKALTHTVLNRAGIKTAKFMEFERVNIDRMDSEFEKIEVEIGYPMYVKPALGSRSITSAELVEDRRQLKDAVKSAFSHHHKIVAEGVVTGRELECVVWGSVYALSVSKIAEANDEFELVIPAALDDSVTARVSELAKTAFLALGCTDFARISFRLSHNGAIYCTRVSNVPGFTEKDVFARLMEASGFEYSQMLDMLVESEKV